MAALQERQISLEFRSGLVALAKIVFASFKDDRVQFEHCFVFGEIVGQDGEVAAVPAGADFVEHLAQTVEIRLRCARPFRRNETLRADE